MQKRLLPLLVSALLSLSACGDSSDDSVLQKSSPDDTLYNDALLLMEEKNYKEAVPAFEEVERQHPYSEWATRAQVMAGYVAYKGEDYDQAIGILDRFVKMHPGNSQTSYAYYLIALSYYERISDVGRDQKMTEEALRSLTEVIKRYPNSEYARDAKLKLDLAYDHLAGKEMEIGRYYLDRQEYLAAINRFRYVVNSYQTTSHVPEALHRLVEAYLRLGVIEEAKRNAAVLGHNYPGTVWYRYSYDLLEKNDDGAADKGWFSGLMP